jgi:hypothetical protein
VRDVTVEFGDKELTIPMLEAREWAEAGIAEWLPRRNRMRFTARRDPRPILRGLSAVVGEAVLTSIDRQVARTYIRNQFLRREVGATE